MTPKMCERHSLLRMNLDQAKTLLLGPSVSQRLSPTTRVAAIAARGNCAVALALLEQDADECEDCWVKDEATDARRAPA